MKLLQRWAATILLVATSVIGAKAADADPVTLVGYLHYNVLWGDLSAGSDVTYYGFYQFASNGDGGATPVSPTGMDNQWANCGGVYADGKYYCYNVSGTYRAYTLTANVFDATTWEKVASHSFYYDNSQKESEQSLKATYVPNALAYDPVSGTIYAFTHKYSNTDDGWLCTVNTSTGELTVLAHTGYVASGACNAAGTLYGIDHDGTLRIYALDGTSTEVGATGYFPYLDQEAYNGGSVIDLRTGDMYWTVYGFTSVRDRNWNENAVRGLVKIDTATGAAQMQWSYPMDYVFSALMMPASHPQAPDVIADLTFAPKTTGSTTGVIACTLPSSTYDQSNITGKQISVDYYVDGTLRGSVTAAAGSHFEADIDGLTQGNHTASVIVTYNGQKSLAATATAFFGVDTPQAVTDLTLTYDAEANTATLSWSLPQEGVNGGIIDVENIRYKIVRKPGSVMLKRSLNATTFTEQCDFDFGLYYYTVTPYYINNTSIEGASANSNKVQMGKPMTMPYTETFDTEASLNSWTIIDANGDGGDNWEDSNWKFDPVYYCAFYFGWYDTTADDWLITPALELDPNNLYKLTFKQYGYFGYEKHFTVNTGATADVEGMSANIILDKITYSSSADMPGVEETVIFAPREGDRYVGFHNITTSYDHLSIDDVHIEVYKRADVPAAATDLAAVITADNQVTVSFTLPTTTADGNAITDAQLTAKIYRGTTDEVLATLTGAPGQKLSWVDQEPSQGTNIYRIVVLNANGAGLEASAQVVLAGGTPQPVSDVTARLVNPSQVELTWTPSIATVDENGSPIDLATVRYLVYKPITTDAGTEYKLIGRDIDGTTFIDNNPSYGVSGLQASLLYYVAPVNGDDEGYATASNYLPFGTPYDLPFAETWYQQEETTQPWSRILKEGATWYMRSQPYEPNAPLHDGYGLMTCEADYGLSSGVGGYATPIIDFNSAKTPTLKYWVYTSPEYSSDIKLEVYVYDTKSFTNIPSATVNINDAQTAGWKECSVNLGSYVAGKKASIVFVGYAAADNSIHLDDVSIEGVAYNAELRIASLKGTPEVVAGESASFKASVDNIGATALNGITAQLTVADRVIDTKTIASLDAGASTMVSFDYTPTDDEQGLLTAKCTISAADDVTDNNEMEAYINVKQPNYPYIGTLRGRGANGGIVVEWKRPEVTDYQEHFNDSAEAYEPFAIDYVGQWTMADEDGGDNAWFSDGKGGVITWPNYNKKQAYIVYDPAQVESASMPIEANSGNLFFASWPVAGAANDDWMISEELSGDAQLISLYARAIIGAADEFDLMASSTTADVADFEAINGDSPVAVSDEWTLYHFALPAGTKYFAIRHGGTVGNGLAIDDVMYVGSPITVVPDGYVVYRNGVKVTESPLTDQSYFDTDVTLGDTYTYQVACIYNGIEYPASGYAVVEWSGIGEADASAATVTAGDGFITVTGAAGSDIDVFAASGILVAHTADADQATYHVAQGVYVVRVGTVVTKVIVK